MCRHLAWLGAPRSLASLTSEPEFGLLRQSYAPRRQRHGLMNADGFGVGWYAPGRSAPVRYRRSVPMWTDVNYASLAPTIESGCVLGAVRSATVGTAPDESCAAPFTDGRRLFSHNGKLFDWPRARRALSAGVLEVTEAAAPVDSALVFGVAAAAWADGAGLGDGLVEAVRALSTCGGGRLTLLATDGDALAAVTSGEAMWVRHGHDGVLLASEPSDDGDDWDELPADHLVVADGGGIRTTPTGAAPPNADD